MTIKLGTLATRSLLAAGLAFGIASAHAGDYNIAREQEQLVQPGMTAGELKSILGAPAAVEHVGNEPGPIWSYNVTNTSPAVPDARTVFDVHFGFDQRVASISESITTPVSDGD